MSKNKRLRVTQMRSSNGINPKVKAVVKGLGLGRIGRTIVVDNTPSFRGMIKKVLHLVTVVEVEG